MRREPHYFIIWNGYGYSVVHGYPGNENVYWNSFGSHCGWEKQYVVCWYAGVIDASDQYEDFDALDELYLLVDAANAPSPNNAFVGSSLISPQGDVYPAPYGSHTDCANDLVAFLFPDVYRTNGGSSYECERYLEREGWIFVRYRVSAYYVNGTMTDAQIETLRRWLSMPETEYAGSEVDGYLDGVRRLLRINDVAI